MIADVSIVNSTRGRGNWNYTPQVRFVRLTKMLQDIRMVGPFVGRDWPIYEL